MQLRFVLQGRGAWDGGGGDLLSLGTRMSSTPSGAEKHEWGEGGALAWPAVQGASYVPQFVRLSIPNIAPFQPLLVVECEQLLRQQPRVAARNAAPRHARHTKQEELGSRETQAP